MSYPTLLDLEGLALNGLVEGVELVDCELKPLRRSRLRVALSDGRQVETECAPYERIVRSYLVILRYIEFGKLIASKQMDEKTIESLRFDTLGESS